MTITGYAVWAISDIDGEVKVFEFGADEAEIAAEWADSYVDSMLVPIVDVVYV